MGVLDGMGHGVLFKIEGRKIPVRNILGRTWWSPEGSLEIPISKIFYVFFSVANYCFFNASLRVVSQAWC